MSVLVKIKNFKSIIETELELNTGVNILIGSNGVGKTCILKSLMFIRDILNEGVIQAVAKNGGFKSVYHRNQSPKVVFSVTLDYGKRLFKRKKLPHELIWEFEIEQIKIEGDDIPIIKTEKIRIDALKGNVRNSVFEIDIKRYTTKNLVNVKYAKENISGKDLFDYFDSSLTKNVIYETFEQEIKKQENHYKKCVNSSILTELLGIDRKINFLHSMFTYLNEYSISPDTAREEGEFLPYAEMLPNGKGLSNVIYALEKKNYNTIQSYKKRQQNEFFYGRRRTILFGSNLFYRPYMRPSFNTRERYSTALNSINSEIAKAVKPINKITVVINKTNGKKLLNFKTTDNNIFQPDEVSDGTIKWLAILVSLYIPFSDIYLLEEPENFLHPWMQQRLIEIMRNEAKKNNTISILTTHSPVVLNKANLDEVIIVKRDSNNSTVTNKILNDKELKETLNKCDFGLGDLWVSGAIGAVPGE